MSNKENQLARLEQNSQMLGIIGMAVEDFCEAEDTTLIGVLRLLSKYHALKLHDVEEWLDREIKKNEN